MAKKSKDLLIFDKSTGNYSGEVMLAGSIVPVVVTSHGGSTPINEIEEYLRSFVQDWDRIWKKVVSASQKELRETGYISARARLANDAISVFSLSLAPGDDEWCYSLGIEQDEILGEGGYIDYSSNFDGTWHTIEVCSFL